MSTYHPDRWVILEITSDNETNRKVFSGNYGGYAGSDTWKLSSVIESIKEDDEGYEILCMSGSTYMCHKQAYGMSGYMISMLNYWEEKAEGKLKLSLVDGYDHRK
jgi:hypothetical protein